MPDLHKHQQFKIRAPIPLLDWVKEQAHENHRTVTAEINFILEGYKKIKEAKVCFSEKK